MNQRNLVVRLSNATVAAFVRNLRFAAMLFLLALPLVWTVAVGSAPVRLTGSDAAKTVSRSVSSGMKGRPMPTPTPTSCPTFTSSSGITIPAQGQSSHGPASPYPGNIVVAALAGNVTKVTIMLVGLRHDKFREVDILLVGPGGQNATILSDVGDDSYASVTLTLDDAAGSNLPESSRPPLSSGTFRPTNIGADDGFAAPAPKPFGGSALSVFNGTSPNGTWSLYVMDAGRTSQFQRNTGYLSGWRLNITTNACSTPTPTQTPMPTPTPAPTPNSDTADRLAQCEARTRELEAELASQRNRPGATPGGRDNVLISSPVGWDVKPSADLKGTLGQIVVQFPGMTSGGNNFVAVFEVGGQRRISDATYGNGSFPLLDGEYDVEVNYVRVSRVPVKRGMDTRIHIGTIRFDVPGSTSVEVYDKTQKTRLCLSYGPMMCGAPTGEYVIKVGGSSKKVTIADGQVIDF